MKTEQIKEITEKATEQLVAALQQGHSEALTAYLKAIGRFHRYSLNNVLLIALQKPNASYETRASAQPVPVIRQLAEILNEYRISMGNPIDGVVFHSRAGEHLDFDRLGQRVVRPAVEALRLEWHGWHGFRCGIASNLYELGANDKIVQRILRHAKPHVTRERYIKAFDPAVLAAMKQMEAALDVVSKRLPTAYQVN